jgi:hypothetical protein
MGLVANTGDIKANTFVKGGDRENFFFCFIGNNSTGKTQTALKFVKKWRESHNQDDVIVAFDPQKRFLAYSDYIIETDGTMNWCEEILGLRNALLILDDYRLIHDKAKIDPNFLKFFIDRTNNNVDIMIICHTPLHILTDMTTFISHYLIYPVQATKEGFDRKISNAYLCIAASAWLNNYVSKYKNAGLPDFYPNFPYIVVDNQKSKLNSVNVKNLKTLNYV